MKLNVASARKFPGTPCPASVSRSATVISRHLSGCISSVLQRIFSALLGLRKVASSVVRFLKPIPILLVVEDESPDCGIISLGELDDAFPVRVVSIQLMPLLHPLATSLKSA